jgi:hypothetical protein
VAKACKPSAAEILEARAKSLYAKHVDSTGIHCNRFPGWGELTDSDKREWRTAAADAIADEPATPEFTERMRQGHARLTHKRSKK